MKTAKDLNWDLIKWMTPDEFDDPDYPGSWQFMDSKTIILCDWLRKNTGWPLVPHTKYGLHGAVCMTKGYHGSGSFHNFDNPNGCSATDFHFVTDASPREQARAVFLSGFMGIGTYQDCWKWPKYPARELKGEMILPIGFHVDRRPAKRFQLWKLEKGEYIYLLR